MVAAIRVVTVQRGIDPRDFALVGFGGAGPMHVSRLADEFGITTVVVPWAAGVASAVGLVSADLGAEHRQPFPTDLDALDTAGLHAAFRSLEQRARVEIGDDDGGVVVDRYVAMRVRGQVHALEVRVPDGPIDAAVGALPDRFLDCYVGAYGVAPGPELQLTAARVRVVRRAGSPAVTPVATVGDRAPSPVGTRPAYFVERGGFVPTPIFDWPRLAPGDRVTGPAVIEGPDTTAVVLPDRFAVLDAGRNLVLGR
jgi:N-methylhydantoinase A